MNDRNAIHVVFKDIIGSGSLSEQMIKCANWLANDDMLADFKRTRLRRPQAIPANVEEYLLERETNPKITPRRFFDGETNVFSDWLSAVVSDFFSNLMAMELLREYMAIPGLEPDVRNKFNKTLAEFNQPTLEILAQLRRANPKYNEIKIMQYYPKNIQAAIDELGGEVV